MGSTSGEADPAAPSVGEGNDMGNGHSRTVSPVGDAKFLTDLAEALGSENDRWRQSFYQNQPSDIRRTGGSMVEWSPRALDDDFWASDTPKESMKETRHSTENKSAEPKDAKQHESESEKHKTRSEVINLIRARTRSRSSASETVAHSSPPDLTPRQQPSSTSMDRHATGSMVYETASVMDYVAITKKKKNKKKKSNKKGKKLDDNEVSETPAPSTDPAITEEAKVQSSTSTKDDVLDLEQQPGSQPPSSSNDYSTPVAKVEDTVAINLAEDADTSQAETSTSVNITEASQGPSGTKDPNGHGIGDHLIPHNPPKQDEDQQKIEDKPVATDGEGASDNISTSSKRKKNKKKGKNASTGAERATQDTKDTKQIASQDLPIRTKPESCKENPGASQTADSDKRPDSKSAHEAPSTKGDNPHAATTNVPSTPSRQRSRKATVSGKDKLPSIQEVSNDIRKRQGDEEAPDSPAEQGNSASETLSVLASTPKSTGTVSTGWATSVTALTPQTTGPSEPSTKGTGHRSSKRASVSSAKPTPTSSQGPTTHAHPPSSSSSTITPRSQKSRGKTPTTKKPDGFFWQLDSHGFPCAKVDCDKRCNLWDGATVICPRCGPYSEVRYCSKDHLFADVKWHWLNCGKLAFRHPCKDSSIPRPMRDGPPLVPCMHPYDTPERHRQSVYFNSNTRLGDYFIFSDWADMVEAGFPDDNVRLRCSSKLVFTIQFIGAEEKDRFRRVLAACLFMTIEAHELIDYLFRLIRDKLRAQNAHPDLETALKYQFHQEFAVTIQPHLTGNRHACETDWDGRNRRNCPDDVCRGEFRRLLGSLGGRGHEQLLEHLEATYWILRAARTTHPDVKDAAARMRGEGFEGVPEEDQRKFCRGDGWDGANSGDMEIEGIND